MRLRQLSLEFSLEELCSVLMAAASYTACALFGSIQRFQIEARFARFVNPFYEYVTQCIAASARLADVQRFLYKPVYGKNLREFPERCRPQFPSFDR